MMDMERPWNVHETAALFRVSTWTVASWTRTGVLPRVPGIRAIRIPAAAIRAMLEVYDGERGEPGGQAPAKAPASRRRQRATMSGPGLAVSEPISFDEPPQLDPVVVRRIREV